MTKIPSLEEFRRIKNSKFGFIVVNNKTTNTLHQSTCENLSDDEFSNQECHWFATLSMAEKSFDVIVCNTCKPE